MLKSIHKERETINVNGNHNRSGFIIACEIEKQLATRSKVNRGGFEPGPINHIEDRLLVANVRH